MAVAAFRSKIKSYVDAHWMVPCGDGKVYVRYKPIDTRHEIDKQRSAAGGHWAAAFLHYPGPKDSWYEGLYLVPASNLARVKGGDLDATKYPHRKMLSSWFDNNEYNKQNEEVASQRPHDYGLNDCAHFVTQSLAAGGIHVETSHASVLFNHLDKFSNAKMLARLVDPGIAESIIKSGIMRTGDVIIYSLGDSHRHSVVYMGDAKIAMHTCANHPNHPKFHGDWKGSVTELHPLVSLIHFGMDDAAVSSHSPVLGWWKVVVQGRTSYYHFERSGRVGYTSRKPAKVHHPLHAPEEQGFWFLDLHTLRICWTGTGNLEMLNVPGRAPYTHLEGTGIYRTKIVADKLS